MGKGTSAVFFLLLVAFAAAAPRPPSPPPPSQQPPSIPGPPGQGPHPPGSQPPSSTQSPIIIPGPPGQVPHPPGSQPPSPQPPSGQPPPSPRPPGQGPHPSGPHPPSPQPPGGQPPPSPRPPGPRPPKPPPTGNNTNCSQVVNCPPPRCPDPIVANHTQGKCCATCPQGSRCPVAGQVFQSCASPCNATCSDPSPLCILVCQPGCGCPSGHVIDTRKNRCVAVDSCSDDEEDGKAICELAPDEGICEAFAELFFYNSTSEACEEFIYGGCGGNGNRFSSEKECYKKCGDKGKPHNCSKVNCPSLDCEHVRPANPKKGRCCPTCAEGPPPTPGPHPPGSRPPRPHPTPGPHPPGSRPPRPHQTPGPKPPDSRPPRPHQTPGPKPPGSRPAHPHQTAGPHPPGSRPSRPHPTPGPHPPGSRPPHPQQTPGPKPPGSRPARPHQTPGPHPSGSRPPHPHHTPGPHPPGSRPPRPHQTPGPHPSDSRPPRPYPTLGPHPPGSSPPRPRPTPGPNFPGSRPPGPHQTPGPRPHPTPGPHPPGSRPPRPHPTPGPKPPRNQTNCSEVVECPPPRCPDPIPANHTAGKCCATCPQGSRCPVVGQVFQSCASPCNATCSNPSPLCILVCQPGCACPSGQVIDTSKNRCVPVDSCPVADICQLPAEKGNCRAKMTRYYYNSDAGKCQQFAYGGCSGNENNFQTMRECRKECEKSSSETIDCSGVKCAAPACPDPIAPSPAEGECCSKCPQGSACPFKGQVYHECIGCPPTCDNYDEIVPCPAICVPGCACPTGMVLDEQNSDCVFPEKCPGKCELHPKVGVCRGAIPRYFYNATSKQCEKFIYGGCGGNENNFETLQSCQKNCSECAPTCTPDFCKGNLQAKCNIPFEETRNADDSCFGGCDETVCSACYYSNETLSMPTLNEGCPTSCPVDAKGEIFGMTCLRKWGKCVRSSNLATYGKPSKGMKAAENFKCWLPSCPSYG